MTTAQSVHADIQVSASVALIMSKPRRTSQKVRVSSRVKEVILLAQKLVGSSRNTVRRMFA